MSASSSRRRKRPICIWVISIFFFILSVWSLLYLFLVHSHTIHLQPAQEVYLRSLTVVDQTLSILLNCIHLAFAITLFFLRRVALYLFVGGVGLNFTLSVTEAMTKGWVTAIGGATFVGVVIGWVMQIAICIYTWRLANRGVLE